MVMTPVADWCASALALVTDARAALERVKSRSIESDEALTTCVDQARADPLFADLGLVRQGVAATLHRFEQIVSSHLSFEHFDSHESVRLARLSFGGSVEDKWTPQAAGANLETELAALESEMDCLLREVSNSPVPRHHVQGKDLLGKLEAVRNAPLSPSVPRHDYPAFYVSREKRSGRLKTAGWTLGILLLFALSAKLLFVSLFVGAAVLFGIQFVVTTQADEEDLTAGRDQAEYENNLKTRTLDLNARSDILLGNLLSDIECRLDERARIATEGCNSILAIARSSSETPSGEHDIVFGACAVSPVVAHMCRTSGASFLEYSRTGHRLRDFVQSPEPIGGCLARLPLLHSDAIEVMVEAAGDASFIGTMLTAAALNASIPGRTRFMFVEPGRLAEAYRVFGALNESASTRLAERLYITHVSELGHAVDALRTFVGRTKEAMTRRAETGRRIGDLGSEGTIPLDRAIVVIDETQQHHWPEKDKRRLSEYFTEIRALAEVGAREGSVFLIDLKPASTSDGRLPETLGRRVSIRANAEGYIFQHFVRTLYPPAAAPADVGAACDAWVDLAGKADSNLRQVNAVLDWSDTKASDTRYGIEVEIGRFGADRTAKLVLGRQGAHHAICIGRTGSGKTNLFHVIISNLVRRYSPDELELYLLDFKEGVEFAAYADLALPHCRAVAIDADRGFGLSVLSHLRRELNRRASVFKAAGVGITSLEKFEEVTKQNMPRVVLLIDEFQVLLQGGERTPGAAPGAAAALEDLVRRGRSFGLHVILGSQTLAGRELTAATLGQLAVRIVLPCSPADANMLLGDQPISSQLRAPGDAVIWSAGQGDVSESNLGKIFAANLDDLEALAETSRKFASKDGQPAPAPFVFRGSGQNDLSEVMPHLKVVQSEQQDSTASVFALGAPTSFGERPAAMLRNARARNLLFVHRETEAQAGFLYAAIESMLELDAGSRAILCDMEGSRDAWGELMSERLAAGFGTRVRLVENSQLEAEIAAVATNLLQRPDHPRTVLAIIGANHARLARSPEFVSVLRDGPEKGIHLFVTCDSVRNLERVIERQLLTEFGIRGLGPASASDSQRILDASDAEALSADQQYLILDDSVTGRLRRFQVLTPRMEPSAVPETLIAEVTNV